MDEEAVPLFRPPSTWMPAKGRDEGLETYIRTVRRTIRDDLAKGKNTTKDNLTKEERKALKDLRNRDDIIIKEADKGSAVVVMSKADYIKEADRHLSLCGLPSLTPCVVHTIIHQRHNRFPV